LRGKTLSELADVAGIDAHALEATVTHFNAAAQIGIDRAFHRGETALERRNGDSAASPNPCMAPIADPPFYAVKILPGDFSTLSGLRTDAQARVLDANGAFIPGLYAAGNDAESLFGGSSAAGGATLGPAMTFGFIAGTDLSRRMAEARAATLV
jgi:predicted oxidoreductase